MSDKTIPERIWIAGYVAGDSSGALTRGLYFRSIHDSLSDAERYGQHREHAEGFTIAEYVSEARVRELEQALELIASFAGKTLIGPYEMGSDEMRAYTTGANRAYEECAALAALHVTDKAVQK